MWTDADVETAALLIQMGFMTLEEIKNLEFKAAVTAYLDTNGGI
jgi:hypothetical protein